MESKTPKKIWMSWSSGKDSAYALMTLLRREDIKVVGLVTTVTEGYDRVAMHAVPERFLKAQAEALAIPLHIVRIPKTCTNEIYEERMKKALREARDAGVTGIAFGDLFLEDVRQYRLNLLKETGLEGIFPIWGMPTEKLAGEMVAAGIQAILTCVDPRKLPKSFAGRNFDSRFLEALPKEVDPCGENGEFHSFVFACPIFADDIQVKPGEVVEREGFVFCDLVSTQASRVGIITSEIP